MGKREISAKGSGWHVALHFRMPQRRTVTTPPNITAAAVCLPPPSLSSVVVLDAGPPRSPALCEAAPSTTTSSLHSPYFNATHDLSDPQVRITAFRYSAGHYWAMSKTPAVLGVHLRKTQAYSITDSPCRCAHYPARGGSQCAPARCCETGRAV